MPSHKAYVILPPESAAEITDRAREAMRELLYAMKGLTGALEPVTNNTDPFLAGKINAANHLIEKYANQIS